MKINNNNYNIYNFILFFILFSTLPLWIIYPQSGVFIGIIRHTHGGVLSGYIAYYIIKNITFVKKYLVLLIRKMCKTKFFLKVREIRKEKKVKREVVLIFLLVFIAGVSVEIIEIFISDILRKRIYWNWADTGIDMVSDMLGGTIIYLFFIRKKYKNN